MKAIVACVKQAHVAIEECQSACYAFGNNKASRNSRYGAVKLKRQIIEMVNMILRKLRSYRDEAERRKRELYIRGLTSRGLSLGANVQFAGDIFLDPSHCFLINIGSNVTFAPNVRIIAHDASTKQFLGFTRIGLVMIGDDCFIGDSVIILPGVKIGPKAIIGAGSIVSKDVPANSVAAGSPARVLCALESFLDRQRADAGERGIFLQEYREGNLTAERRNEMVRALAAGQGFIV